MSSSVPKDGHFLPRPYTKYILTSEQASTQTLKMLKINQRTNGSVNAHMRYGQFYLHAENREPVTEFEDFPIVVSLWRLLTPGAWPNLTSGA